MSEAIENAGGQEQQTTTSAESTQANTLLGGIGEQQQTAADTLLGGETTQATETTTPEKYQFPEKFQVKAGEDLDFDASVRKLGEAYTNLEKRFGAGEARPADVSGYTAKLDEEFGAGFAEGFSKDPNAQKWMQEAFDLGLNTKQLNFFIKEMIAAQPSQAETATGFTPQQATEALQKEWTEPGAFQRNLNAADRAARALLKDSYPTFIGRYGNDPDVIKLLSAVGSEMSEDSLRLAGTPTLTADSLDDLMASEAYRNEKHPDHRRVSGQVREFFNRKYGTNDVI